jgi:hypothetical protein
MPFNPYFNRFGALPYGRRPIPYGALLPGGGVPPADYQVAVVSGELQEGEAAAPKSKKNGFVTFLKTVFALLFFGAVAAFLYYMGAELYGYAIVAAAAVLVFTAFADRSKGYKFLSLIVALGFCGAALYFARPDITVPILDSLKDALDKIIAAFHSVFG